MRARKRKVDHTVSNGVVRHWHTFNPGDPEEVIEARFRRQRHEEEIFRQRTEAHGPIPQLKKGPLDLNEVELAAIRTDATIRFLDHARVSDVLREQRRQFRETYIERLARFDENPDGESNDVAELHAVLFADACGRAVGRATGDFADMLTQAAVARRGRKDFSLKFRTQMWTECLRFAMSLARLESAYAWIDKAWGDDPREDVVPRAPGSTMQEITQAGATFKARFGPKFEERIWHGSRDWLDEADRKIELRLLLSAGLRRRVKLNDPSKRAVVKVLMSNPNLTTGQICAKLDAWNETNPRNAPLPESWKKRGARSWIDAYEKMKPSVKTFVSTVRNKAGIAKDDSTKS